MTECEEDIQARLDPAIAHVYGEERTSFHDLRCTYQSLDEILQAPQTCRYLARADHREFAVRYADSNPADKINAYPYYGAERIITAAATECNEYLTTLIPNIIAGSDGSDSEFVYPFENSTGIYSLSISRSILAREATTYIWNDTNTPSLATEQVCGPRCIVLFALRDMDRGQNHEITIFQCRITISPMFNITNPAHALPDSMARTAAASIALSGRWRASWRNGRRDNSSWDWRQFQLYQDGAAWALNLDDSPEDVGARMAEFAASTLATMAQQNPSTTVLGKLPTLGYQTDVERKGTGFLTGFIAFAHFFIAWLTVILARSVIVVDDDDLMRVFLRKGLMETDENGDELQLLSGAETARGSEHTIRAERTEGRRDGDGL